MVNNEMIILGTDYTNENRLPYTNFVDIRAERDNSDSSEGNFSNVVFVIIYIYHLNHQNIINIIVFHSNIKITPQ